MKKSEEEFAPILPQEEEVEAPNLLEMMEEEEEQEETGIDLQKELEAKFDELFGPIDEE